MVPDNVETSDQHVDWLPAETQVFDANKIVSGRVMQVVGLFRSHEEILYVMGKLQPLFDREFHQHVDGSGPAEAW